jgi:hypothetical protein
MARQRLPASQTFGVWQYAKTDLTALDVGRNYISAKQEPAFISEQKLYLE